MSPLSRSSPCPRLTGGLQWLTILSLDAPLVALCWQWTFARLLGVTLRPAEIVLLGISVWLVYAADRWLEGWRVPPEHIHTRRHAFYHRWRTPAALAGAAGLAACGLITFVCLPPREIATGSALLAVTLAYLCSHQHFHRHHPWRVPKEICVALIFFAGTAFFPAFRAGGRLEPVLLPGALFALLCFANCALIAIWEAETDTRRGEMSLARQWRRGHDRLRLLPWLPGLLGLSLAPLARAPLGPFLACAGASGFLLAGVDLVEPAIGRESARTLADIALMTPLVWLALA
ncbi:hypothetical protein OPIT5_18225 [Opitutaceae bacterium TAV5]|nr:hypothetical protein OPIT5_18225 [Opitutaceae bacterium TAV5]